MHTEYARNLKKKIKKIKAERKFVVNVFKNNVNQ